MKRLLLVALVLVVLLVVPANAYDTIWTDTLIGANAGDANVDRLYFGNSTLAGLEQWHITVVGHDAYTTNASFPTSGMTNVSLIDPTTSQARGNATFTWFVDYPDWAFTWDIIDLTPSDPTHLQYVPSNAVYNYIIGNGLQTLSQSRQTGLETNEHSFYQGQFNGYYAGGVNGTVYTVSTGSAGSSNLTPDSCSATLAAGYVRTYVHIQDRSGNAIHGSNIEIRDNEWGEWANFTHDADGIGCIDTYPAHHVNIYGSYDIFANEFLPNSLLGQNVGTTYYLTLFPYETGISEGNVSLSVEVRDADTGYYIPYATVRADVTGGLSYSQNTANHGTAIFTVPNSTVIKLTASASGYDSGVLLINSGTGTSYTATLSLHRSTVTPTATATTGPGGTVPTTVGPYGTPGPGGTMPAGYTNNQGQMMMDYLAANGLMLIQLCVFVTIAALLGFKFGK